MTSDMDKDKPKPPVLRRPDVLRKLNADSLYMIERGLLGDLPDKLKPPPLVPSRAEINDLAVAKPSGLLSACLPIPDSPISERVSSSEDESKVEGSPLKKTFSFRDRLSRISFFNKDRDKDKDKDKEKPKWKTIVEDEKNEDPTVNHGPLKVAPRRSDTKAEQDYKSNKRFWFFRSKELEKREKGHRPVYMRSKSFEFLPRALEEDEDEISPRIKKNIYPFGSRDTMGDAWTSNESLEYLANIYHDSDDGVCLKSIKEIASDLSYNNSSTSIPTSGSSVANVKNILKTESVEDVFKEFKKAVELFSENYLSDCEPYTKTKELTVEQKRKSCSFTTLPSPKVVQVVQCNKVSEARDDFKKELSRVLSLKREVRSPTARRGSVTDWFVLEDKAAAAGAGAMSVPESNKYRRGKKKDINRVRRISSTKYWITPEECAVYSRDQRPPLVIPRITQYRNPRPRAQPFGQGYHEEDIPEQGSLRGKGYEALNNWSPTSERSRPDLDIMYNKSSSDSPPFVRINKRLGGSTENLLTNARRPSHLLLPASSSGDSLDVEIREREPHARNRKSRSMVAPKNRLQSPIPAPRHTLQQEVILEGPVKRTKFLEGTKKTKKNWIDCYMVLTPTALVFYKDQRTYYSSKVSRPPGTPPSPSTPQAELVLALLNAHATQCIQKHTKRYTRSILLIVGYDQYLIQDETEDGARKWFAHIRGVIFALYQCSLPGESPPPTFTHNNADADSLGRTPPTARHAIRNKHKDEPVFGRNLEEVCPATSPRVPEFVVACVKEIERPDNMCTDGLYRASGNLSQVQKIRLEVDQNKMSVIQNNTDIHVLTGSLKLFFRELKEPLIPCSMFDRVLAACSIKPKEARIKEFQEIVKALPPCNRDTLKFLLEHLIKVTEYKEQNRMHTANLAIVFGPTLLWAPPEQAHNIAVDCIQQNNVVDILLTDFKEIFVDNGSKGKKKA
ncbi:uncharacterized protein LOC111360028 isoform X2 [Spodoptera litura]|uniref:Uncharacterized protein LOC111360028 isoform X2 n=1 Tax=Spodoptera litura TaxID=69820 RepID=A0A9J7EJG3_SPOLT|nr:uncharacterized protein LOC111360028 isoform X2 [Spodoptera litura]